MAFPNKFRFYFYSQSGTTKTWYFVDSSNVIQTTNDNAIGLANPLQHSPNEWDGIEQSWERSESMHGIFTKISNEYSFSGDGAKILRHFIFTFGYSAKLKFAIYILDSATMTYSEYLVNDVNFHSMPTEEHYVKASLYEGGLSSDFMSSIDIPYKVELSGSDVVSVLHEGTQIAGKYNYRFGRSLTSTAILRNNYNEWTNLLIVPTNTEGFLPVAASKTAESIRMGQMFASVFFGFTSDFSDQYNRYIFTTYETIDGLNVSVEAKIRWRFVQSGSATSATNAQFYLRVIISADRGVFLYDEDLYVGANYPTTSGAWNEETITGSYGFASLPPDYRVYIVAGVHNDLGLAAPTSTPWGFEIETVDPELSRIAISVNFRSDASLVEGFRLYKLLEKTFDKFRGAKYNPISTTYLSSSSTFVKGSLPYKVVVTNGNALKGVSNSKFKIDLKTILEDCMVNYPIGLKIEGDNASVVALTELYKKDTIIADIGELTDWSISVKDELGNNIEVGNKFTDTEVVNGDSDYNTTSVFKADYVSPNTKKTAFISPFISSIFNIEKIRVSGRGKDTTASKESEDFYKFSITDTVVFGSYLLRYHDGIDSVIYNISNSTTRYNAEFSPANMLNRIKPKINSMTYPSSVPYVFTKSSRSADVYSLFFNYVDWVYFPDVYEDANITPSSTDLIWLPFFIKCRVIIDDDLIALFKANPYGVIQGTINGNLVEFFIDSIKFKPSNYNTFDIEGRLSPNTNIANLI